MCMPACTSVLQALTEATTVGSSTGLAPADAGQLGFDPTVNAHLSPMGPPRAVKVRCRLPGRAPGGC
jgi:hypothetical protein